MRINPEIYDDMKAHNDMITTKRVMELGFSKALLSKYTKEGLIERVRQGIYILSDAVHDDMYTLMQRSEYIIFSHESALFLLGLSERTPFEHSVTIPSNTSLPNSLIGECKCYYVKPEVYRMGMIEIRTTFGNYVRCYNAERSICDMLRSRNRIDEESVVSAVKNYVIWKEKNFNRLAEYAIAFRVMDKVKTYLEVLT